MEFFRLYQPKIARPRVMIADMGNKIKNRYGEIIDEQEIQ